MSASCALDDSLAPNFGNPPSSQEVNLPLAELPREILFLHDDPSPH